MKLNGKEKGEYSKTERVKIILVYQLIHFTPCYFLKREQRLKKAKTPNNVKKLKLHQA